jgi:hypothetical protein
VSALRIVHTAADGTLLYGSSKGDGAWEAIKAAQAKYQIRGWRYMPSIGMVGVSHSRDRAPNLGLFDVTADVLREAGFEVEIDVEAAPRPMEQSEADRAEHMDDRADALAAKADRKQTEADSRWSAAQQIAEGIPAGQPILVGHHSERGHRRDLKRMDGHQRKSIELGEEAKVAEHGASTAAAHMRHRENPRTVWRRVKTLEADLRRARRSLDGYTRRSLNGRGEPVYVDVQGPATGRHKEQLDIRVEYLTEQIRYWNEFLDGEIKAGRFNPVDLSEIKKGDKVRYWGGWRTVTKVNKVTVSVESGYSWDDKVSVDKILEHEPAAPPEDTLDLDALTEDAQAVSS